MNSFMLYAVLLSGMIVIIGFFNEKKTKLTYEIALMLFSVIPGVVLTIVAAIATDQSIKQLLGDFQLFDIEDFLMKGVLCFMLFAGSCHMHLKDFKRLARPIGILAIVCTLLGAIFYGGLFYIVALLLKLPFSLPMCLMFGSIVAPTDPIAATSILNKFGLPEDISFIIEGESLLNDGVGVALFVCFSGMVKAQANAEEGFFVVMFREIFGAVLIGVIITFVCHYIFVGTKNIKLKIVISLFMVALSYYLCELFDCSGAIASVVCGVLFATLRGRNEEKEGDLTEFDTFWEIIDNLLNSILYVMMGFSFARILQMPRVVMLSIAAVICNLLGRSGSLGVCSFLIGKIPDGYDRKRFVALFTWGGLRGGLSIALAMSTSGMLPTEIYYVVLGCTYAIAFFTTVIQGLSMRKVYEKLKT